MSWLTDLAGKAENLLNKIDQNAAVVLKDKTLINDQLTDVIWNSTSFKRGSQSSQDETAGAQYAHSLPRSSPSGAPSPSLRSSPRTDSVYLKRSDEDDLFQLLSQSENVGMEDGRGSPSGASIPSVGSLSPIPSRFHSRNSSHGGTMSLSSSCVSPVRDDSAPQHCFKPVEAVDVAGTERMNGISHPSLTNLLSENNMLKNEVRCLNNEMSLLVQRCKAAEKEVRTTEKEVQNMKDVMFCNEELKSEICSLQTQLCHNKMESNPSLLSENTKCQNNSMDSEKANELKAVAAKFEQMSVEHESLAEENRELHLQISRLQAALNDAGVQSERHRQQLQTVTLEAEQYRARATRVLQDKERFIASLQEGEQTSSGTNTAVLEQEVDQLKEELRLLRLESSSQAELLQAARNDLQELELQNDHNRQNADTEIERLCSKLHDERSRRISAEEDYRQLTEEVRRVKVEFGQKQESLTRRLEESEAEMKRIQGQASSVASSHSNSNVSELEARVRHLATALMQKQGALEALIAERNALQLQIEQNEKKKSSGSHFNVPIGTLVSSENERALRSRAPTFMDEIPSDTKVTRQVQRAYFCLDNLGMGIGVFLRRYPLARRLVIIYMVILHFWVAFVLSTYSPEAHSIPLQKVSSIMSPEEPKEPQ